MKSKIEVRLHYVSSCSGNGCCCAPDKNMIEFEKLANKIVEKFGEDCLHFGAYNSIDIKQFPFLKDAKSSGKIPVVTVGTKVVASGKLPTLAELEKEISSMLKVL